MMSEANIQSTLEGVFPLGLTIHLVQLVPKETSLTSKGLLVSMVGMDTMA